MIEAVQSCKAQSVGFSAPFGTFHVFWKPCAVHLCISSYHPVTPIGKCPKNAGVKCDVDACASVLTEACHLKGMETDWKQPHSHTNKRSFVSWTSVLGLKNICLAWPRCSFVILQVVFCVFLLHVHQECEQCRLPSVETDLLRLLDWVTPKSYKSTVTRLVRFYICTWNSNCSCFFLCGKLTWSQKMLWLWCGSRGVHINTCQW